jgi:hypothetical protein
VEPETPPSHKAGTKIPLHGSQNRVKNNHPTNQNEWRCKVLHYTSLFLSLTIRRKIHNLLHLNKLIELQVYKVARLLEDRVKP